jgi:hypothetical protein
MVYARWWNDSRLNPKNEGLSMLDIVESGTLDCRLAALLWILMEQRASVLVAAGPSYAGKTTLLHAMLDFLPPNQQRITLRGYFEDFRFVDYRRPRDSYLVTEEISNHMYEYLWGAQALKAFRLMSQGWPLGGTIHARTAEESIYVLNRWIGLSLPLLNQLGVIVTLQARSGRTEYDEPVRRVNSVNLIFPDKEGLAIQVLATRPEFDKGFQFQPPQIVQEAIAARFLIGNCCVNTEIETRTHWLKHLRKQGQTTRRQVRSAVVSYYRSRKPGS